MRSRFARLQRTIARDCALIIGLLVATELVLRLAAPIYGRQLFDNEFTGSFPIEMNPEGYRGALVSKEKALDELRILGLGDSITFGTAVRTESTWPIVLGEIVGTKVARPVVAINGGVEGESLGDIVRAWDEQWRGYHPDVVAIALTGNMVSLEIVRPDKTLLPSDHYKQLHQRLSVTQRVSLDLGRAIHRLGLPSFASIEIQRFLYWDGLLNHNIDAKAPYGTLLAHGWRQGDLDPTVAETAWGRLASRLGQLKQRVEADGALMIVTYMPPRFLLTSEARDNQKNVPVERFTIDPVARTQRIAEALHLGYVDSQAALISGRSHIEGMEHRPAPMYVYFDYAHPDDDGHRAIAEVIAATLIARPSSEAAGVVQAQHAPGSEL